jgi:methionyl aminopeptidase
MIYIKSNREIEKIRAACKVVAGVLALMKKYVKSGISTYELNSIADDYIKTNNGKPAFKDYVVAGLPKFPAALCTSVNSCIVHGIPSAEQVLVEGDIISIDVGVELNSYFGDAAVTLPVGNISLENQQLLKITQEALDTGISYAKCGYSIGDISATIGDYVARNGYFTAERLTGHGVGRLLHEEPVIPNFGTRGSGHPIKKGMTLALEPMVNIGTAKVTANEWEFFTENGQNSAHFEHTILVTDTEPEILTI